MPKPPTIGHVVEDYYIGRTHIRICDDYCRDQTPEQAQAILDRIAARALIALQPVLRKEEAGS